MEKIARALKLDREFAETGLAGTRAPRAKGKPERQHVHGGHGAKSRHGGGGSKLVHSAGRRRGASWTSGHERRND